MAWDCATGTGQAAIILVEYFDQIIATDASSRQIAHARMHPKISYRVASADNSGIKTASIDLITIAQSLHWFDTAAFYRECRRVLKPGGAIAAWCYGQPRIPDHTAADSLLSRFYHEVIGAYWPSERQHVEAGYQTLPFVCGEIETPEFSMKARYSLQGLAGYISTWSATQAYIRDRQQDPVPALMTEMHSLLPEDLELSIRWPLSLRVALPHS